ncbi:MAG: imidazole glycerol phosphate synthase subunit HisH [Bacteroidales bacterium]|jgi:glutamine amidotransferase|nr:imidazole glycerol phosphate synthase subunit HisH [Bacteroidales bacterium]
MNIAIIKYNAGNIYSVDYALKRLGVVATVTDDGETIRTADKVLFPGQGEASSTMAYLQRHGLDTLIRNLTQPVLGICIGMQLLCRHSDEGDTPCLGVFDADVKRFVAQAKSDKIPHIGWNTLSSVREGFIPKNLENEYVYFVHSYYVPLTEQTVAATDYILPFSSALQKDNFYATQFHPEKSGDVGEKILKSFLDL